MAEQACFMVVAAVFLCVFIREEEDEGSCVFSDFLRLGLQLGSCFLFNVHEE